MEAKHQKYILDNAGKKTSKEIADALGLKERKVRKLIESKNIKTYKPEGKKASPLIAIVGLTVIFIIALVIRFNSVIGTPETFRFGLGIYGDTMAYHNIAYNLARGAGFCRTTDNISTQKFEPVNPAQCRPAFHRGPVYPFYMSLVYRFWGLPHNELSLNTWHINLDRVRLTQCVLDSLCCFLVFFIVHLLLPASPWPALTAALLYAFSVYNIFYVHEILSETVNTFLVTLFVLVSIFAVKRQRMDAWFLTGLGLGLVVLARPEYLLFAGFLSVFICFIHRENFWSIFKNLSVFVIGMIIVIAPWSFRNYEVFKKPIIVTGSGPGEGLYYGTVDLNDNTRPWSWDIVPEDGSLSAEDRKGVEWAHEHYFTALNFGTLDEEKKMDNFYTALAFKRIRQHPMKIFMNWVVKMPRLWYQNYVIKYDKIEASGWYFIFYFVFAVYGVFIAERSVRLWMMPIVLLFVYLNLIFMPVEIEPRYGVALMPAIISLTAVGLWSIGKLIP